MTAHKSVFASKWYADEVAALKKDAAIVGMTIDVYVGLEKGLLCCLGDLQHEDGFPRTEFAVKASRKYEAESKKHSKTINGPALAIFELMEEWGYTE